MLMPFWYRYLKTWYQKFRQYKRATNTEVVKVSFIELNF